MLDHSKRRAEILRYKRKYNPEWFIETGTFMGDTADAMKAHFKKVYTIELSAELAEKCQERFRDCPEVEVFQGNSADLLGSILHGLNGGILFWLDAHYSGEFYQGDKFVKTANAAQGSPILNELDIILSTGLNKNVILIDDARCFVGANGYPTKLELKRYLNQKGVRKNQIQIKNDIIRIVPDNIA
ncbi:MAG: hypothetical protein M9898_15315 [Chitinophagaceae bacterium]|nr:hypothetical protein [Chitinophagaceae bacterium]